jgi:pimeloyl-ACP methyl ester carboxylesterase
MFILLACAGVVALLSFIAQRRHPPIGRFFDHDGVRLHYIERGPAEGKVVVFLHGNGGLIQEQVLSGVIDLVATRYRVVCFDRPGYGYSTRPRSRLWTPEAQAKLLAGALARFGVESAIVVGHSWGAMIATAMALEAPHQVRGVVLASGYYYPTLRKDVWLFAGPAVPVFGDLFRFTVTPLIGRLLVWKVVEILFAPKAVPDVFLAEFPMGLVLRPLPIRASAEEAALMVPAAARLQCRYAALPSPAAVVHGESDRVIEYEQAQRLQKALPRAVLRSMPGIGHMTHYAEPQRILDAIDLVAAWPEITAEH